MDIPVNIHEVPQGQRATASPLMRLVLVVAVTAALAFVGGVLFANATDSPNNNNDFKVFWQSWDILSKEYYFDLPDHQDMVYSAIQGLLASTGDRYTFFVPPDSAEVDRQVTAGEFGGIGANITLNAAGQVQIGEVFAGMPAAEAGLQAGDIILAVDGRSVEGLSLESAVRLLRGETGSRVRVTVSRPSSGETLNVTLARARIELPTVSARLIGTAGYVRLYSFNGNATALLEKEIGSLLDQGADGLILDLRGNPGGLLDEAVSVSDLFLDEGVVVKQRERSGDEIVYRSTSGDRAEQVPVVVLVDGGSASASEVVAGALHDRGRAVLVGQKTFGKGLVQHVHDLPDGSQLHVTAALWFTPDDTLIQGQGLSPDIEVAAPEDAASGDDPVLAAGLEALHTDPAPHN